MPKTQLNHPIQPTVMNQRLRILLLCILNGFAFVAQAQTPKFQAGRIFLKNGEDKLGLIAGEFHLAQPKGVYFKVKETTDAAYIPFERIQSIQLKDAEQYQTYCTTLHGEEKCLWLEVLVKGKASLYRNTSEDKVYYFEEGNAFTSIHYKTLPGLITLMKRNCPEFKADQNNGLDLASMVSLIVRYNDCLEAGNEQQIYHQSSRSELFLGPKLGLNFGSVFVLENNYYQIGNGYTGNVSPTLGLSLILQSRNKWSAYAELSYLNRTITNDTFNFGSILKPNLLTLKIKLNYLELPIMVQYRFSRQAKYGVFAQVGGELLIPLSRKFSGFALDDPSVNKSPQRIPTFLGWGLGWGVGLGMDTKLTSTMRFQVLGQYALIDNEFRNYLAIYPEAIMNFTIHRFQLGGQLLWAIK